VQTAEIDGVPIRYAVAGGGDATPIVVLHGGLGLDSTLYRRTLGPLAADRPVVHFDQRGNGRSVPADPSSITMERLADDVVALGDRLALDRFVVLGHSYGAFVAQELALRHPDRLAGMVLVSATPGQLGAAEVEDEHGVGPPMPPEVLALISGPPPTDDAEMAAAMKDLLPAYFHRPDVLDLEALEDGTVFRAAAMVRGFEVLASWSSVDRLATIAVPTLVLAGRHDVFTAWPQAHRIGSRIPGADVMVFEESGHFPWLEEPDRFFALVGEWVGRRV
jgi:proline iminopeptidase